mgnify:CR=1 FL=1
MSNDTVKLLKECDSGIKMAISSIEEILEHTKDENLFSLLSECRNEHIRLKMEVEALLKNLGEDEKEPNPMAKGMSWVKINIKMAMDNEDKSVADLITDGCNMRVKSLNKYLNKYENADEKSRNIANKLIAIEKKLTETVVVYL